MKENDILYNVKSVMLGHAVGDALGVPVEFVPREKLEEYPVTDMEGFGTFAYEAGTWSDDTSMSLAAFDGLSKGKIDWDEIMQNFGKWLQDGEYTPSGEAFDVGRTCLKAIMNYFRNNTKATECGGTDEHSNGNGSLMRIHPFALYEYAKGTFDIDVIHNASALTHAHERSKMACGIYSFVLWELLKRPYKESIRLGVSRARSFYKDSPEFEVFETMLFKRICGIGRNFSENPEEYFRPGRDEIKSSGYVVDSLEAAIWCLKTTSSYKDCVLKAVNLGGDTDTIAAIAGGLAGALYGYDSIPTEWLETLAKREYIENMCEKFSTIIV